MLQAWGMVSSDWRTGRTELQAASFRLVFWMVPSIRVRAWGLHSALYFKKTFSYSSKRFITPLVMRRCCCSRLIFATALSVAEAEEEVVVGEDDEEEEEADEDVADAFL